MPRTPSKPPEPTSPTEILVSRSEATSQLTARVELGRRLRTRQVRTVEELKQLKSDVRKWSDYNGELLTRTFSTAEYHDEYYPRFATVAIGGQSPSEEFEELKDSIDRKCERLESIIERLPLIPESKTSASPSNSEVATDSRSVFIVHGHDEGAKQQVARFVEKLGCTVTILAEQPNKGRTIIEKFEDHAAPVAFAIVLLTPDDVGRSSKEGELKTRARQNVVLELGYFFAKLGRSRVCAMHTGGVELPSDIHGILYLEMNGDWKLKLAREMRAAGLPIDMNAAV